MQARIDSLLRSSEPDPSLGGLLSSSGKVVPADGTAGYLPGCTFQHIDGGAGTVFYINEGTATSCAFAAVAGLTAAQEASLTANTALLAATAGTVTASLAVIVDASKNIAGFGTVGCGAITAAGLTSSAIVQINDNVALNFEGVASDIDGLQITCDNAGDALLNVTAGKLTLTTSDGSILTASTITGSHATSFVASGATVGFSMTGAATDGIKVSGICADGVEISGACTTTGINISADCVTGITIAAQTTAGITIASTGIGIEMNGTYNNCLRLTNSLAVSAQTTVRVLDTYTKVDGYHTAVMGATLLVPAGGTGTGAAIGVYGEANIQGECTGTNYSFGVRGTLQLTDDTTLNGASSIFGAINASMKDDATPTLTSGHVCGIYIENLIDANLAGITGITAMIYAANNASATCTMDYGMYLYGPKVTNLLGLYDCTVSGCVSAGGTVGTHGTATLKIAIDIDGTTYYLLASTVPTFT